MIIYSSDVSLSVAMDTKSRTIRMLDISYEAWRVITYINNNPRNLDNNAVSTKISVGWITLPS